MAAECDREWSEQLQQSIERIANDIDGACKWRLRETGRCMEVERQPCLKHAVTLNRIVHVLALRAIGDEAQERPVINRHPEEKWRWKYHRYQIAVAKLNAAFTAEGAPLLRDKLTGLSLAKAIAPDTKLLIEWEKAAIPGGKFGNDRRAAELLSTFFGWPLLAEHFDESIVVELSEVTAWAEATGIAVAGEIANRLKAIEARFIESQDPASTGASKSAEPTAPVETTSEKPADGPKWYDIEQEKGCRRMILENWGTIALTCGNAANGGQVLRQLKIIYGKEAKLPELKTVQNRLRELRKEKLIP